MPSRVLDSNPYEDTPVVRVQDKVGSFFKGQLVKSRNIEINKKPSKVYDFKILDGDAHITKAKKDVDIPVGTLVTVFGSRGLDKAISQVQVGAILKIVYNGKKGSAFDLTVTEEEA